MLRSCRRGHKISNNELFERAIIYRIRVIFYVVKYGFSHNLSKTHTIFKFNLRRSYHFTNIQILVEYRLSSYLSSRLKNQSDD